MQRIVECVPNFSDGRRPEVYNAIARSIREVAGTRVLQVSADADHNRTVITFVGTPEAVEEAAFRAIRTARDLINLEEHEGEHPRIGATDVCPFVPVKNVTLAECAEIAHRVGRRVGEELDVTVYLYAEAATRPERVKLSDIRKGEYERWKSQIGQDPAREPDYGPAEPHPWGATVIGARPFLIAYNIYLNTGDVSLASKIARTVRTSSGGLQNVQALGFLVEGQAQVSMNLLNFERTPIHIVQELIRREAARYGLTVTKAELVGLTPQAALIDAARWYLQLDGLEDAQLLEYRLAEPEEVDAVLAELIPHDFLEAVAGGSATPGGGAVAALAGALAAALVEMVANLTVGRKKYAEVDEQMQEVLADAHALRGRLTEAIVQDAAAFDRVMAAYRDKSLSEAEQKRAIEEAMIGAGEAPLAVARACRDVARLAQRVTEVGNSNAVTDAASGILLANAAVKAAGLNVRINGSSLENQQLAHGWRHEVEALEQEVAQLVERALEQAAARGGF